MITFLLVLVMSLTDRGLAVNSKCEECHKKVTPEIVKDFNRGKMARSMTCADCHGDGHMSADDVDKVQLPTISTCEQCHEEQVKQYMSGKHALGPVEIKELAAEMRKQAHQ